MLMTAEDDLEEVIANVERDTGRNMDAMREMGREILAMDVGDHTPPPPSRLLEPALVEPTLILPPALHEGINEAPEGKFYLPPFGRPKGHHFNVGDIAKKLYRTRVWVAILTMYAISATVVAVWNW